MDKCIYCGAEIHDGRCLSVCNRCGINVWGEKMFKAIAENMQDAKERGDLSLVSHDDSFCRDKDLGKR